MSSKSIKILMQIVGLVITILLLVQPWFISAETASPFINSGWAQIIASIISIFVSSLLLAFYRPIKQHRIITNSLLLLFIALGVSLYYTHYTICLRYSLIYIGLLSCIGALRLLRTNKDNFSIASMVSLSGFLMAVYCLCQYFKYDFLVIDTKYPIVGTLTNPNYVGIFLCISVSVTVGLVFELIKKSLKGSIIFFIFFIVQITSILLLEKAGLNICLFFIILIWICSDKFSYLSKSLLRFPLVSGFILALILFITQWFIHYTTLNYHWEKLTSVPPSAQTFVSRITLWQMGYEIFKLYPFTGTGAGSIPYVMPLHRPVTGTTLRISYYNDDPHSFIISILAETGFLGLWGISALLSIIFGVYTRKKSKYDFTDFCITEEDTELDKKTELVFFPWKYTSIAIAILFLGFKSGYIKQMYIPYGIILIIAFFGIATSILNKSYKEEKDDYYYLSKGTLTAIFTFAFYSSFNNTFSVLPLTGLMTMILSLHLSCSLPEVKLKPQITGISLFFVILPIIYGVVTCKFQKNYQYEQDSLYAGLIAETNEDWEKVEKCYLSVINSNHQYLPAYEGLANSFFNQGIKEKILGNKEKELGAIEKQKGNITNEQLHIDKAKIHYDKANLKFEESQDVLTQLDTMVPNINNVKLKIAHILLENNKILEAHRYAIRNLEWSADALSYELLGNILLKEGRTKEAESIFKEALILSPSNLLETYSIDRIHLNLAVLSSYRTDYQECKKHIASLRTEDIIGCIEAKYIKGQILTSEKKYDEALYIFESILLEYPEVPRILNATGYLLMISNKDLPRAQFLLEKAFNIVKNNKNSSQLDLLNVSNSLGILYQKLNMLDRAGELLKLSYENTPEEYKKLKEKRLKDLENFYNSFKKAE